MDGDSIADLCNEQLLLVDIATHRPVAYAPFTDEIKNWLSVDPLVDKNITTSPYLYCNGNPIMFIDQDGRIPSSRAAALMADYVYADENQSKYGEELGKIGWNLVPSQSVPVSIKDRMNCNKWWQNGFESALFSHEKADGTLEYAYVFAGTNSFEDALEDIAQVLGIAPQYYWAIDNAKKLSNELGQTELTFVGHSLGGGEATAASLTTGRTAITFNPAAISANTMLIGGLNQTANIVNYVSVLDPLNAFQCGAKLSQMLPFCVLPGTTHFVRTTLNPIQGHSMDLFLKITLPEP